MYKKRGIGLKVKKYEVRAELERECNVIRKTKRFDCLAKVEIERLWLGFLVKNAQICPKYRSIIGYASATFLEALGDLEKIGTHVQHRNTPTTEKIQKEDKNHS